MADPITINVTPTNPGQFFACAGLHLLMSRLPGGASSSSWFAEDAATFQLRGNHGLFDLLDALAKAPFTPHRDDDIYSSPFRIGGDFGDENGGLSVDWWESDPHDGRDLKVWAGTMESRGIAEAMRKALAPGAFDSADLLDIGMAVKSAENASKKKEPFYFDARRGPSSDARDIGFAPNDLKLETISYPAVELLCLVGLQAALPLRETATGRRRMYRYHTWTRPLAIGLPPAAVPGLLPDPGARAFVFENAFRTSQKKHKAFMPARPA